MSNFFSFLIDETRHPYYFTHAQRLSGVASEDGQMPEYDSHASIAEFYHINADHCNKYEYNPFSDTLKLSQQNVRENKTEVQSFIHSINWQDFCGDIEGAKKFIASIKNIQFMQNNPDFDLSGCKVFDTREDAVLYVTTDAARWSAWHAANDNAFSAARFAAIYAARNAEGSTAISTARDATREVTYLATVYAAYDFTRYAARSSAKCATMDTAMDTAGTAANDIALYVSLHYVCAAFPIPQEHLDYINKRLSIWQNGYGVFCDVGDTLYVYRDM